MKPALGDRLLLALAPPLAALLIRLIHGSMRIRTLGLAHLQRCWDNGEHVIFAIWHDQLLMVAKGYPRSGAKALISPSKDGELIARTLKYFDIEAVRGSSSRQGTQALRALVKLGREPADIGITPDGPKGPRHQVKQGVAQLAKLTGRPVLPYVFVASCGHRFASWDRFLLPYPWGNGVFLFGEPLWMGEGESLDEFTARIAAGLERANRLAEDELKNRGLPIV